MNYWSAEITNLDMSKSLFEYFLVNVMLHGNPLALVLIWNSVRTTGRPEGLTLLKLFTIQLEDGLSVLQRLGSMK